MKESLVSTEQIGRLFPIAVQRPSDATNAQPTYFGVYVRGNLELTVHARFESGTTHLLVLFPAEDENLLQNLRPELFKEFADQQGGSKGVAWYEKRGQSYVQIFAPNEVVVQRAGTSEEDLLISALQEGIRRASWVEVE